MSSSVIINSLIVGVVGYFVIGFIWDFVAKRLGKRKP